MDKKILLMSALILATMCSCSSSQKILYLQDLDGRKRVDALINHEPEVKPDDRLYIVVSAPVREVAAPYNLSTDGTNAPLLSYRVDADGCIDFPVLGRVAVGGRTLRELTRELTERISTDVKDPVVSIAFADQRVTILGEVHAPGTYNLPSERTTIFQAIGMAGDMSIAGRRSNVLLLREVDGRYEHARLDLRHSDIFNSPYYYIQRNDLIYIAPAPSRIQSATTSNGIISVALSAASLLLAVTIFIMD
jgi:polysaccharide export outer membrane protein